MRPDEQEPDKRRERGTSQPPMAKSKSIKDAGRRFGGCAWKAVELTSGDLRSCPGIGAGEVERQPERDAGVSSGRSRAKARRPKRMEGK